MTDSTFIRVVDAIRSTALAPLPERIEAHHSLVYDLGFDSMGVAMLSIALEDQFAFPVLLDTWIGAHDGPDGLTVGSLRAYMESLLDGSAATL